MPGRRASLCGGRERWRMDSRLRGNDISAPYGRFTKVIVSFSRRI